MELTTELKQELTEIAKVIYKDMEYLLTPKPMEQLFQRHLERMEEKEVIRYYSGDGTLIKEYDYTEKNDL